MTTDTDYLLRRIRVARATVPKDGPTDRVLAQAHDEIERLRRGPLRDDEPTRMTAGEVRQIMDEAEELSIQINGCDCPKPYDECTHEEPLLRVVERLEAENRRLGELVAQHAARADYWTAQTRKAQEALAKGSTVDPRRCPASGTVAGINDQRVGPDRIICPTCGRIVSSHRITGTIARHNQDARR